MSMRIVWNLIFVLIIITIAFLFSSSSSKYFIILNIFDPIVGALREGVVQLGSLNKVVEDLSHVVLLRKKFAYIESIPGVLLPHPSSAAFPALPDMWAGYAGVGPIPMGQLLEHHQQQQYYGYEFNPAQAHQAQQPAVRMITPSMSSLEALLSKLPSVGPTSQHMEVMGSPAAQINRVAKEEMSNQERSDGGDQCSSSMTSYHRREQHQENFANSYHHHHHDLNLAAGRPNTGF